MSYTAFMKLLKPPFDSVPWDEAINGNMDTIDAYIANYMSVPNYTGQWKNDTLYTTGQTALDNTNATIYQARVTYTSSPQPMSFLQERNTYPGYWLSTSNVSSPVTVITVSDAPPPNAKPGDFWFDSVGTQLYLMYSDGNSSQWVICNNSSNTVVEAPSDGHTYARKNGAWVQIA